MKAGIALALTIALIGLSGCNQPGPGNGNGSVETVVEQGDNIAVEYRGTLPDGAVFDQSEGREPLEFTAGSGQMISGFDNAVVGMRLNEEKTVTLQPSQAYGEVDPSKVAELPKSNFAEPDKLVEGLPVHSTEGANGIIKEIKEDTIVVDFNHPLAGKTLAFWIKVVKIEKQ